MSNTARKNSAGAKKVSLPTPPSEVTNADIKEAAMEIAVDKQESSETYLGAEGEASPVEDTSPEKEEEGFKLKLPENPEKERVKGFYPDRTQAGMWKIKFTGGGLVPGELSGEYTHKYHADLAIEKYLREV